MKRNRRTPFVVFIVFLLAFETNASQERVTLNQIDKKYSKELSNLKLVRKEVKVGWFNKKDIIGFKPEEVKALREEEKSEILAVLNDSKYAALRFYVKENYPNQLDTLYDLVPVDDPVEKDINKIKDSIFTGKGNSKNPDLREDARKLMNKLESSLNDFSISFKIDTEPDGATFALWPEGGSERNTTSDSSLKNIYRGLYYYSVNKSGYKPIVFKLNLVDETPSVLVCYLVKNENNDEAKPCQRE